MTIISNGFGHFHLKNAAVEVHRRGKLGAMLTGAYPTKAIKSFAQYTGLENHSKILRLLAREEPDLIGKVNQVFWPEVLAQIGIYLRRFETLPLKIFNDWIIQFAFIWYGNWAARLIVRDYSSSKIYHYRAGYGGKSVKIAKQLGMVTLCDHSIIHPRLLDYFIENRGHWPEKGVGGEIDLLWRYILEDIQQADHVIVNSDFVKDTFLHFDWNTDRVHSIYWGIDDTFLAGLRKPEITDPLNLTLIFAGNFSRRKGAEVLVEALERIDDVPWRLELFGTLEASMKTRYGGFFDDPRVSHGGLLSRAELAQRYATGGVFLFPTFAEGSARVIFEAMASGCYIITTPNAGSIVKDKLNGALVPPGDGEATERAVRYALQNPAKVRQIGANNARLIAAEFGQSTYGDQIMKLYDNLLK